MLIMMVAFFVGFTIVDGLFSLNVLLPLPELSAGEVALSIFLTILFFAITFIIQAWGQTALLYAIKDSQEKIRIIESYRKGWRKIFSYWWIVFLAGLITTGGFVLLVIPGVIFAIWFSLAVFILIAEDLRGMNALLKSREYVKGKWISVFWRFFFIGALYAIIVLVPNFIFNDFIFNFFEVPFASNISGFIIGLFLTPLVTIYGFLVYSNLKAVKGEVVFASTRGKKTTFFLIGIVGNLIIPAIIFSIFFLDLILPREKAHDVRLRADIRQIQLELDVYYDRNNNYPTSLNELDPEHLRNAFTDPLNQPYQYQLQPDGADYKLYAELEVVKTQYCVNSQL